MRHHWIPLLFTVLGLVTLISCSPAPISPPTASVTPLPADKPAMISPVVTEAVVPRSPEASIRQPTAVTITRTQPGGTQKTPSTSSGLISSPLEPALQQVVTQAREDLARRLGVPVDSVRVDAIIGQEFSTDAFSCRTSKDRISKDESPPVVSGQSILLSASAHRYEYHASGQTVIFCRPLP